MLTLPYLALARTDVKPEAVELTTLIATERVRVVSRRVYESSGGWLRTGRKRETAIITSTSRYMCVGVSGCRPNRSHRRSQQDVRETAKHQRYEESLGVKRDWTVESRLKRKKEKKGRGVGRGKQLRED
jgi:hypothetical protein